MAKETNFPHPSKGHSALLAYDPVNDRWQAVHVDADGNLQVDVTAIVDGQIHLYAWDGDSWEKVTIDASGHLQVDVAAAVDLNVQNLHYDGAAWRKSNLLWGYHDVYGELVLDTNADAGANTITGTAVPAGEVWVVTTMCCRDKNNDCGEMRLQFTAGGIVVLVHLEDPAAANTFIVWTGEAIMAEGDYVTAYFTSCTAGDDLELRVGGYKMDITM